MDALWDDEDWTPSVRLTGVVTADVCVVGLGGSGLTAVDELLSREASVVGLAAGPVASGAAGRWRRGPSARSRRRRASRA